MATAALSTASASSVAFQLSPSGNVPVWKSTPSIRRGPVASTRAT